MSTDPIPNPLSDITSSLEQRLDEAKKEKILAQVPALRRLDNVCRTFFFLGILSLIFSAVVSGSAMRSTVLAATIFKPGIIGYLCLGIYAILATAGLALAFFLIATYSRFNKQFKSNDAGGISATAPMLLSIYKTVMLLALVDGVIVSAIFHFQLAIVGSFLFAELYGIVVTGVFYIVLRKFVKAAKEELPTLAEDPLRADAQQVYRSWEKLYSICLAIAVPIMVVSYVVFPPTLFPNPLLQALEASPPAPAEADEETLMASASQAKAAAIASGDHWTWAAAPGWVNSKPVGKFAALRNHPGGSDQLFAGLIVESGGTATSEQIVAGIESAVQSSGQDFTPISAEPDQIAGRTWTQFEFTMTYQNLPLHYIYRAYASPDGCYTLVGWSLQSDFASGKYLILQAFDTLVVK